ncbi:MAG: hypothetical protein ACREQM_13050 [Candidatus Dormibacteraceae bacterium]
MRDRERAWRLGLRLYDVGLAGAGTREQRAAVERQAARLRALAAGQDRELAGELRALAESLDAELRGDAWSSLAEAEELFGWTREVEVDDTERARREQVALEGLERLRTGDPAEGRPIAVLREWIIMRRDRREGVRRRRP